jgi:hypothetical protein
MNRVIPERWRESVQDYFDDRKIESWEDTPFTCMDFDNNSVAIEYEDGSYSKFKNAFFLFNNDLKEFAIFTEHCGYHYIKSFDGENKVYNVNEEKYS